MKQVIMACKSLEDENRNYKHDLEVMKQERANQDEEILKLYAQIRKNESASKQKLASMRVEVTISCSIIT
jgi:hypothetical protein